MPLLKKLFSRNRKFKKLKLETAASRFVAILEQNRIDTVIDVGANTGQTAEQLRAFGYGGKIISYEPIGECHAQLETKSASDPNWSIAPRCALGEKEGSVELQVSEGVRSLAARILEQEGLRPEEEAFLSRDEVNPGPVVRIHEVPQF